MSTTRLPRFIVLRAPSNGKYLIHLPDKEDTLRFSGADFTSPSAKFEVVPSSTMGDEYVHIKCCSNNKYWVNLVGDWVTASAHEMQENGRYSSMNTVFKLHFHQAEGIVILTQHRTSKSVMISDSTPLDFNLCVGYAGQDGNHQKFRVIGHHVIHNADHLNFTDWDTLPILPKYFALKDDKNKYLEAFVATGELVWKHALSSINPITHAGIELFKDPAAFKEVLKDPKQLFIPRVYLRFNSEDKGEEKVGNEVFTNIDGTVRIKNNFTGQFWRCRTDWIFADSLDETNLDRNTLFTVHKFEDHKIALKCVGNDKFCMRFDDVDKYLNAGTSGNPKTIMFTIEDLVSNKRISNVRYDEANVRIRNHEIMESHESIDTNNTSVPQSGTVEYEDTVEVGHTWTTNTSLKKSVEIEITAKVPYVELGKLKFAVEQTTTFEKSKTSTQKTSKKHTRTVTVPPNSKVISHFTLSKVTCDLPYTYTLSETHPSGKVISTEMYDGVYNWVKTSIKFSTDEKVPNPK